MQTLERHSERIWYMTPVEETDRPILGAVVGDTHTLMIDAGNSEEHARLFVRELEGHGVKRPSIIALTHWHWDHIFGLSALSDMISISCEETRTEMLKLRSYSWDDDALKARVQQGLEIEFCATAIQKEFGANRSIHITLPTLTFKDELTIDLGGVHAVMKHVGGDHAADSVVVYIPEEKVLFLGDALYANLYAPSWRMTPERTMHLIGQLDAFEAEYYVWSHGGVVPQDQFEKDCDTLRRMSFIALNFPGNIVEMIAEYERLVKRPVNEEEQELITFFVNGLEG